MTLECPEQAGSGFQRESMVAPSVMILGNLLFRGCLVARRRLPRHNCGCHENLAGVWFAFQLWLPQDSSARICVNFRHTCGGRILRLSFGGCWRRHNWCGRYWSASKQPLKNVLQQSTKCILKLNIHIANIFSSRPDFHTWNLLIENLSRYRKSKHNEMSPTHPDPSALVLYGRPEKYCRCSDPRGS
jgi:hypothetical protein